MGVLDVPMKPDNMGLFVPRTSRSRMDPQYRKLFVEDFRQWPLGMFNDGVGDAYRDHDVMYNGKPSVRLDTQGQSSAGATSPGRTAATAGVVFKRRVHDAFTGIFALECWFRFTGANNNGATTPQFSLSVYNRTGVDTVNDPVGNNTAWHSRLYLAPNGNNQDLIASILDGTATNTANGGGTTGLTGNLSVYTQVDIGHFQNAAGSHTFDPSAASGRLDRAGGWHYAFLATDLAAKKYVSCKIDGNPSVDLSAYNMDATTTSGFAGMHFSFEYSANTSTRRYMNIAEVAGYGS